MADQRRRQRSLDRDRGAPRRALLACALALTAACSGDPVEPSPIVPDPPGEDSGTGVSTSASIVGAWENDLVVTVEGDVQRWRTEWLFTDDGRCRKRVTTLSLVEGIPRISERDCVYEVGGGNVSITFAGTTEPLPFDFSFAGLSPDRLLLDGLEYRRLV